MDRPPRQKINKEAVTRKLEAEINVYRTFQPRTGEHTFFSSAYRAFSRTDHIPGEPRLDKFKMTEITLSIFLNTIV